MSSAKQDILSRLSKCHDQIKEHPFRTSFASEYISDYKYLLYHLTEIWCDLIWRCDELTDMERARLRYFDGWIHDFRQYLRTWDKTSFPMWCFDYYEQMLQVTHTFIDTGEYPEYYNLDVYFIGNAREVISTKHIWVTEESCGIKSEILPCYFPIGATFVTDEEAIKRRIHDQIWSDRSESAMEARFEYWLKNTKPVLEYLNSCCKSIEHTLPIWHSMKLEPSKCRPKEESK